MKANELMIGDWVQYPYGIRKVTELDGFLDRVCSEDFSVGEVDAIPLTPEILEKNGFSEVTKRKWVLSDKYTGDEVLVLYEVAKGFAMPTSGLTIGFQNVHELQHLFKLCGMTKEIEL